MVLGVKKKKTVEIRFYLGIFLAGAVILLALAGFVGTPYEPEAMDAARKLAGVSAQHPMGCDQFGRDILSRVMKGTGTTLLIALGTVSIGTFFGVLLGACCGYFGGWLDEILMRINDAVFAFPSILLALLFIGIFGPGSWQVVIALGIAFIPSFARIVRGEFLQQKSRDYVKSAKLMGAGSLRIVFVHILPNILPVLLSALMIGFNNAVLAEAGMSFLGIGVQPPAASLGRMLSEAQAYLFTAPGYALFPGLVIVIMVLGFSLAADSLRK